MRFIRFLALLLSGVLLLCLFTACSSNQNTPAASQGPASSGNTSATLDPTEPLSPGETELPVEDPVQPIVVPPTDSETPDEPTVVSPASPAVSPPVTADPSVPPADISPQEPAGTSSTTPTTDSKVETIWSGILDNLGLAEAGFTSLDASTLSSMYGIDANDLTAYVAKLPMMGIEATEFFIALVKEGKMETVKNAIMSRQAALADTFRDYLPDQLALVENYQLVTNGDYVMFCVCKDADSAADVFHDYTK